MRLTGRVAMVTGAARGIGAAIASTLAAEGADVAVCDLDLAAVTNTAESVAKEHGHRSIAVQVDVADSASVTAAVDAIEHRLGPLDILVNNAGIDVIQPFVASNEATWDRLIAVNLKGPLNTCHAVVTRMLARGSGKIVNIGSDAGRVGSSGEAVYSATKGGVIAFTKTLAREVAAAGITVNCVCPGPTDTALLDQVAEASQKLYDSLSRAIPMRRIAQPLDIAPVVAFLVSDDAGYMTGQTLSVSGGLTMC
jgi:2-hydroxycyclohexanecarboxyl-CoA dehydrogenase